jgi:hypothetical protein
MVIGQSTTSNEAKMTKKILSLAMLFAILMMACTYLLAQDANRVPYVAIATPSPVIHPMDAPPAGHPDPPGEARHPSAILGQHPRLHLNKTSQH